MAGPGNKQKDCNVSHVSRMSKVFWGEGLFLRPQHFQRQDAYHEARLQDLAGNLHPHPWGIRRLRFDTQALATGTLLTGHPALAAGAVAAQLVVWLANLVRLRRDQRREWNGTVALHRHPFGRLTAARWALVAGGAVVGFASAPLGFVLVALGELTGRYLFYVTVVPLNIPGSFFGAGRRH